MGDELCSLWTEFLPRILFKLQKCSSVLTFGSSSTSQEDVIEPKPWAGLDN